MLVYLSNFPYSTTPDNLRALLSPFGPVENARVKVDSAGLPLGYGFAEMAESDAQRAIDALNGTPYGGRRLKVSEARPPRHQSDGAGLKVGVRA